jgi:adenylate kinase
MLAELDRELSVVLHFQVTEDIALERLRLRGRTDDTPETIKHRMNVQRVPDEVIEYYRARGILVGIHADRSVDEVFTEVQDVLETAAARR